MECNGCVSGNIISACPPMARLHQVVNLGIQAEAEGLAYFLLF